MLPRIQRASHEPDPRERMIGRRLALLALGVIAFVTLLPNDGARSAALTELSCLVCGDYGAVDVLLNTALFFPFGLALGLMRTPWHRIVLIAFMVTAGIELSQLTVIPGRDASLSDLLTNTAGAAVGAAFALHWRRVLMPAPAMARRLFAAFLIAWALSRLSTAWLLRPSFPESRWFGQVAPTDVYPYDFRGTVVRGELAGLAARSGEMPELRAAFRAPEIEVRALVTDAKATRGLSSVLSVLDEHRSEVVLLGQERDAARLRFRLRAADLRFRTPSVRLDEALVGTPGERTELAGRLRAGSLTLTSASSGRVSSATLALGPGLGWALLLPFDVGLTSDQATVGTAAFTALALLGIGFFAGLARPDRPLGALATGGLAAAIGLAFPLLFFPEAPIAVTECAAGLAGVMSGTLAGVSLGRFLGATPAVGVGGTAPAVN